MFGIFGIFGIFRIGSIFGAVPFALGSAASAFAAQYQRNAAIRAMNAQARAAALAEVQMRYLGTGVHPVEYREIAPLHFVAVVWGETSIPRVSRGNTEGRQG